MTIPAIVYFTIFLRDAIKTRQTIFAYLALLFGIYLLQHVAKVQQFYLSAEWEAVLFFVVTQIAFIFIVLCLSIIMDMFEKNTPYSGKQTALTILAAIAVGGLLVNPTLIITPMEGTFLVRVDPEGVGRAIQEVFLLVTGIVILVTLFRSYQNAIAFKQKSLLRGMFWGTFIALFIGSILPGLMEFGSTHGFFTWDLLHVPLFEGIFQDLGILLLGAAIMRVSKNPWLLQRQQVYFILVLSRDGVDLYSKVFNPEITPTDLTLFSGGFSAVTSLFQEVTKTSTQVKSIVLEENELRLINREHFICAMLVDNSTQASEVAHQKFTNEFEALYGQVAKDYDGNAAIFEAADRIAEKYFD